MQNYEKKMKYANYFRFLLEKFAYVKKKSYLCSVKRSKVWKYVLRTGAASLMLLLFASYYVDVNFFCHSHIVNGVTIVHSHFHNQHHHDTNEGGHTTTELTLIANMAAQFLTTGETPQTELTIFDTLIQILGCEQATSSISIHLACPSLRAPPSLSPLTL